jgi:hypothetical protein
MVCNANFSTNDVSKKAEFDSECLCFPERRFERNEADVKHRDLKSIQKSKNHQRRIFLDNYYIGNAV